MSTPVSLNTIRKNQPVARITEFPIKTSYEGNVVIKINNVNEGLTVLSIDVDRETIHVEKYESNDVVKTKLVMTALRVIFSKLSKRIRLQKDIYRNIESKINNLVKFSFKISGSTDVKDYKKYNAHAVIKFVSKPIRSY